MKQRRLIKRVDNRTQLGELLRPISQYAAQLDYEAFWATGLHAIRKIIGDGG